MKDKERAEQSLSRVEFTHPALISCHRHNLVQDMVILHSLDPNLGLYTYLVGISCSKVSMVYFIIYSILLFFGTLARIALVLRIVFVMMNVYLRFEFRIPHKL
jgi:hypothetical protein